MSLVENLKYKYQDFVIDVPRWEILDQGVTVLSGPSGSGKTTIFRLLLGLEKTKSFSWSFGSENLAQLSVRERRIGVVFQSLDLFPHMNVEQNILFAAKARGIDMETANSKMSELLRRLGISHLQDKSVQKISGGEKQRVALCRALIGQPRILFLDEPFSALDAEIRQESRLLIKDFIREQGVPTLLVTHDKEDVQVLADKISYIQNGTIAN